MVLIAVRQGVGLTGLLGIKSPFALTTVLRVRSRRKTQAGAKKNSSVTTRHLLYQQRRTQILWWATQKKNGTPTFVMRLNKKSYF